MALDPNAVPGLLRALDNEDVYVRITAAEALGKIGNPVAIGRLFDTFSDDRPDVRRRVVKALERIGVEPKARAAALVVPGLAGALRDPDVSVRWEAESALRRINTSAARAVLEEWRAAE
ncbi:MAG: HEAT repeat domain-containing protein [Chloroflexi bacterium]|nr:HEAT repeat domain-containing protein [Chloroflexota bacterium]